MWPLRMVRPVKENSGTVLGRNESHQWIDLFQLFQMLQLFQLFHGFSQYIQVLKEGEVSRI